MDKRTIIFIIASLVILIGWQMLFAPKPPEVQPAPAGEQTAPAESGEQGRPEMAPAGEADRSRGETGAEAGSESPPAADDAVAAAEELPVSFENDLFELRFTNRGARVLSWQLKEYRGLDGEPLELLPCYTDPDVPLPLGLDLDDPGLSGEINDALFEVERISVPSKGELSSGERITFRWADGTGYSVSKALTFRRGDYLVDVEVDVRDRGRRLPARLVWGPGFHAQGEGTASRITSYYNYRDQAVWNMGGNITRVRGKKVDGQALSGPLIWAGQEDQYFTALVLPSTEQGEVRLWKQPLQACPTAEEESQDTADAPLVAVSVPPEGAMLYVGPKEYTLLRGLGHQLGESVWFSSHSLLKVIARSLFLALLWIHDHIVGNYGLAIILATVALRIVLFPLNQFSMVRMRKAQVEMQRLQPKINAIKNKYRKHKDAESRAKMNKETMALYQKEGVSPMGGMIGCLPMLAQFPILIGFYNMLTVTIELRGAPFFGWIQDLSQQDPYFITPILMGVTMFAQQKLSQGKVTDPMQRQQQRIMMIMPLFFTYLCIQMPSGMVLYWFVNNVLGIGQQWLVNRHTGKLAAAPQKA